MNRSTPSASGSFTAVIFDLDGVLVDTAEFHYLAWKTVADELGVPFDRKKNERLRGVPRMRSLEIIVEDLVPQPPLTLLEVLAERKNVLYVAMVQNIGPGDLLPGVAGLLDQLKRKGIKMSLGSSSKNARAVIRLLGIEGYLDAVVDGFGFEHAKPAPDVFINASRLLGVPAGQCVVVEDAQAGIDAAKAAHMFAVGIDREGTLIGADIVVPGPADIPLSLWGIT
jgi:beta-phosphoglucomutase